MLHQAFDALFVAALVAPPTVLAICFFVALMPRGHHAASRVQHAACA